MKFSRMEADIQNLEQDAEKVEQQKTESQSREAALENAISKLMRDINVCALLERNKDAVEQEREHAERSLNVLRERLSTLWKEISSMVEQNESSRAVLEELREIGEDVSDSEALIAERTAKMEQYQAQLRSLTEQLGGGFAAEKMVWNTEQDVARENDRFELFLQSLSEPERVRAVAIRERSGASSETAIELYHAMETPEHKRTWRQTELIDKIYHGQYETQNVYIKNPETGKVERLFQGKRVAGSQAPDSIRFEGSNIYIREIKNYTNMNNLIQNIKQQTQKRRELFGSNLKELTFVVEPNQFTLGEAKCLYEHCKSTGVNLEWIST